MIGYIKKQHDWPHQQQHDGPQKDDNTKINSFYYQIISNKTSFLIKKTKTISIKFQQ